MRIASDIRGKKRGGLHPVVDRKRLNMIDDDIQGVKENDYELWKVNPDIETRKKGSYQHGVQIPLRF